MKLRLFRNEISKRELREFPELEHFSLPDDRWVLAKNHCRAIAPVLCALALYCLYLFIADALPDRIAKSWAYIAALWGMNFAIILFGVFAMPKVVDRRERIGLHRLLRERGVYYCANPKCRYNCTGIRGNTCPECGATVPGLSPA